MTHLASWGTERNMSMYECCEFVKARLKFIEFLPGDIFFYRLHDVPVALGLLSSARTWRAWLRSIALDLTPFTFCTAQGLPPALLFRRAMLLQFVHLGFGNGIAGTISPLCWIVWVTVRPCHWSRYYWRMGHTCGG